MKFPEEDMIFVSKSDRLKVEQRIQVDVTAEVALILRFAGNN
jgi:hypothetical protein